jgi:hypothetical protein
MIRRGLIAGSARDWANALAVIDRGKRLPRRETNFLLDQIVIAQDAEQEARAVRLPLPPGKGKRHGGA